MSPDLADLSILASVIGTFPEAITVVRRVGSQKTDFVFALTNEAFEVLARAERETLLGARVGDHFPTLEESGYFDRCVEALESGQRQEFGPSLYDDGRLRAWTKTTYTPLDEQHVMIAGFDLTEEMDSISAQNALVERMERVERLAKVASWEWDLATNTLLWSPELWAIYGLQPRASITYEEERELIHPDDREARDAVAAQWLAGRSGGESTYRVIVGGRTKHLRGVAEPIIENGKVVRFVGAIHDITEVVEEEERRIEAERRFRTLFEVAPLGIALFAADGTVTEANPASATLFGMPAESSQLMVGLNMFDDSQMNRLGLRWYMERALAGETVQLPPLQWDLAETLGVEPPTPGAHSRWLDFVMFPFGEGGAAVGRDVTITHLAREQLRKASAIIDNMSNGLVVTDFHGTITDVNPAFTEITGYSREEVVGQNPRILKSGSHDSRFYQQLWRDLIENGKWSGEITNRRKDGTAYRERLTITSLYDHDTGAPNGFVGVFTALE